MRRDRAVAHSPTTPTGTLTVRRQPERDLVLVPNVQIGAPRRSVRNILDNRGYRQRTVTEPARPLETQPIAALSKFQ